MKFCNFLIALTVIVFGGILIGVAMMNPGQSTDPVRETDVFKFRNDFVHVFRDDKRGTTCYVLNSDISCVKDASNLYEDLYR